MKIIKEGYVKINNSSLFCSVAGEGDSLVLIHGNFNDYRIWSYQVDSFSNKYKVVCYDQRGYGKSHTPTSSFSHYEDLKYLLDSLQIKKANIIGSSSGGSIAIDFALEYPEYVKSLVLVSPSINGYRYPMRITVEAIKSISLLKLKGFESAIEKFIINPFWSYFIPPSNKKEAREKVLETLRTEKNFYSWNFKLALPKKPYAIKLLSEIKVPTLIVLSDRDSTFNIEVGEYIYKGIINSKKIIIHDCGHLPFVERPEEFNQNVLDFLDNVL